MQFIIKTSVYWRLWTRTLRVLFNPLFSSHSGSLCYKYHISTTRIITIITSNRFCFFFKKENIPLLLENPLFHCSLIKYVINQTFSNLGMYISNWNLQHQDETEFDHIDFTNVHCRSYRWSLTNAPSITYIFNAYEQWRLPTHLQVEISNNSVLIFDRDNFDVFAK